MVADVVSNEQKELRLALHYLLLVIVYLFIGLLFKCEDTCYSHTEQWNYHLIALLIQFCYLCRS